MNEKKTVGIFFGGPSHEEYLSKKSIETVIESLNPEKYDFILCEWLKDGGIVKFKVNSRNQNDREYPGFIELFSELKIDILFNAMHGEKENYGKLSGFCELLNMPYTGNGIMTSILGINKILSNILFEKIMLNVPAYLYIKKTSADDNYSIAGNAKKTVGFPMIIKPVCGGSSYCTMKAINEDELNKCLEIIPHNMSLLIQKFIKGKEYSAGIFGSFRKKENLIYLPVAHVAYDGIFFDDDIKKNGKYSVIIPSGLDKKTEQKLLDLAEKIHLEFHFEAFSRSDFIIDDDGNVHVLEVNTHPGLSRSSIVTNMMLHAGLSFSSIIDKMIEDAMSRIII